MNRSNWKRLLVIGLSVVLLVFAASQAQAGWGCGRCGYWGGCYGCGWGGYWGWGGYYGAWGRGYGWGCGGCCGGWGGYYGPYYDSGCSSCLGKATYGTPSASQAAAIASSAPTNSGISTDSGLLTVSVPADAKVTVNGHETRSTGSRRQYYSSGLESGRRYPYVVRAQIVRDGQVREDTRTVTLTAGQSAAMDFAFDAASRQVATNP
jgi:uncharacterized protein (TIGR03000 family)